MKGDNKILQVNQVSEGDSVNSKSDESDEDIYSGSNRNRSSSHKDKNSKKSKWSFSSISKSLLSCFSSLRNLKDWRPSQENSDPRHTKCLIYPENTVKENWDLFMVFVLIASCMTTPINLAFEPKG